MNTVTPRHAVWTLNKNVLWYYPSSSRKYCTPLFLVYSLVNRPYILDLAPGMSMIGCLNREGFDVYLLDFGISGYEDKDVSLEDYILTYIERGLRRTRIHSGSEDVISAGYCLGGTMALIHAAVSPNPPEKLVLFAPPVDFSSLPGAEPWTDAFNGNPARLKVAVKAMGMIPAPVVNRTLSSLFPASSDRKAKPANEKHALIQQWLYDSVPFSGKALSQVIEDMVFHNRLVNHTFTLAGQPVDTRKIRSPLLLVTGTKDTIVPKESSLPVMAITGSRDQETVTFHGGHITLAVAGTLPNELTIWLKNQAIRLT
ncbi:hydroxyalkanoic acid synthase [Alteribacter lacisalsi]|uniref:Hydroxyalkanoic acid synthase n=1 Tax=Alteribacter lacisalsi TaxID=2045244 RepID=A0A2W0H9X2_9BACI|nr:alpha/beta fold hydrolase [Alteribacter lacisalsi]PYZ97586.1 hydroxyalkanoic acid synthase [Alteribacter lacisalsi]